ncbi:hypothetical protein CcaverHIS002_0600380 [Cutaneotrichosporon cavernicola]|uniref:Uncharacterized protein n=1 Tax=Cutaneotrichosporon cavernicola TaxID=279322 RepID=A0AA48L5L9_9TREE|nr:uncharacterized protein CcaverHIS019_0500470 [Cutaneotrichosporon cavernicola]BEI85751.1 hypothetical protein CcaverHIS002_0600380 [Cutaneotrichosporon cavernicola]BEI92419.1 hypothetical protein CcaverHIS019_0500470 [Cutaneotrichosporon cavernicola]BEJ00192.1 hypothetical protein CcaverHIS631_0500490 [Cutaneotrichosporon cavernicola]BEJ07963.1 hypothetical protein CcaverHIS641_0500480 [Cutaneotrichosporon cavernicola]
MPSNRWEKHDAAMGELYERVENEKAEADAAKEAAAAHEAQYQAQLEAQRAAYLANPAVSSETTLVAAHGHQPVQSVATHRSRAADDSEKAAGAWERFIRWQAKHYRTNLYDKPKPGAPKP